VLRLILACNYSQIPEQEDNFNGKSRKNVLAAKRFPLHHHFGGNCTLELLKWKMPEHIATEVIGHYVSLQLQDDFVIPEAILIGGSIDFGSDGTYYV
jgi:hypothetical protein